MKFKFYTVVNGKEEYIHIKAKTKAEATEIMKMKYPENKIRQIIIEDDNNKSGFSRYFNSDLIKKMTLISLGIIGAMVIAFTLYPKISGLINKEDIFANTSGPSATAGKVINKKEEVNDSEVQVVNVDKGSVLGNYMKLNGVSLSSKEVKFDMANNVGKDFAIYGHARLDDYYNYGFRNSDTYFSVKIRPIDGKYSDEWNIYLPREQFGAFYKDLLQKEQRIILTAFIPEEVYVKNQGTLAMGKTVSWHENGVGELITATLDPTLIPHGYSAKSAEVTLSEVYIEHDELLDGRTNGKVPMVLKVKVTNTGSEDWIISQTQFSISTPDGGTFTYTGFVKLNSYGQREEMFPVLKLLPGQSGEGWIGFEPSWSDNYILSYSENRANVQLSFTIPEELIDQRKISYTLPNPIIELISGK